MRFSQVLMTFAAIGILVPLIFLSVPGLAFDGPIWAPDIQLYLWPPSILYLATDGTTLSSTGGVIFEAVVVLLNVPVYLLFGTLVWVIFRAAGLLHRKHR
jgi:hypothetical protein